MFLWRVILPLQGVINRGPPLFFICIDWHGCPWINKHTKRHVIHIVQQTKTRYWTFLSFYRFLRYAHLGNQDDTPPLQTKLPLALVLFSFVPLVGFRSDYITVPDLRFFVRAIRRVEWEKRNSSLNKTFSSLSFDIVCLQFTNLIPMCFRLSYFPTIQISVREFYTCI